MPQEFMKLAPFTPVAAMNHFNASKYVRVPIRKKNTASVNHEGFGQMCSDFDRESSARETPIIEGETVH